LVRDRDFYRVFFGSFREPTAVNVCSIGVIGDRSEDSEYKSKQIKFPKVIKNLTKSHLLYNLSIRKGAHNAVGHSTDEKVTVSKEGIRFTEEKVAAWSGGNCHP
jgi:hypothetical protein